MEEKELAAKFVFSKTGISESVARALMETNGKIYSLLIGCRGVRKKRPSIEEAQKLAERSGKAVVIVRRDGNILIEGKESK